MIFEEFLNISIERKELNSIIDFNDFYIIRDTGYKLYIQAENIIILEYELSSNYNEIIITNIFYSTTYDNNNIYYLNR